MADSGLRRLAPILFAVLATAAGARAQCVGDCDASGAVGIAELIRGVNIALGLAPLTQCPSFDTNGSGSVQIGELISAVNAALRGCAATPTASATPVGTNPLPTTPVGAATPTPSETAEPTVGPPPDPADIAPMVDAGVASDLASSTEFLYAPPAGVARIQTDVAPGAIEARRAAVLHGRVLDRAGIGLAEVLVRIADHPELGQTLSRSDGRFDMAVNGGGALTVLYAKDGFFPAQRQIEVGWQEYAHLDDVVLVTLDARATAIDLASGQPQVARGSTVSDADGTRQATLLFPSATTAEMVFADGSRAPLSAFDVRLTEFTVGENGPQAMPAELPIDSAYTYALVFTADQALAAGAEDVYFSRPLPFYVDNFLDFPVGIEAPLGAFDRQIGAWTAADSGRVIKILAAPGGLAEVDSDGDDIADDLLSLSDEERGQLAALYAPGKTLWRVLIPHFDDPWDINWGFAPPDDAVAPNLPPFAADSVLDHTCNRPGSLIECQNQILREDVAVSGTPFALHYASDRAADRGAALELDVPLSGATIPASLDSIELVVRIAGRELVSTHAPLPNQHATVVWDGRDVYGRTLQGQQAAKATVRYVYRGVYQQVSRFGYKGNGLKILGSRTRQVVILEQTFERRVGGFDARGQGLGGWDLDVHHIYDPLGHTLYGGDGSRLSEVDALGQTIDTFAGTGDNGVSGDGGPARAARIGDVRAVAVGPDGSVFILDSTISVRQVRPDGIIQTLTFHNPSCYAPCASAAGIHLQEVYSIAVDDLGRVYLGDRAFHTVRRLDADGMWRLVAGTPFTPGFAGDGGPAVDALLNAVEGIAVGPDRSVYVLDRENKRVRRIGPDGVIATIAGNGSDDCSSGGYDPCGLDGPALAVGLGTGLRGAAVAPDGTLAFGWSNGRNSWRILQITADGRLVKLVGGGEKFDEGNAAFDESLYLSGQIAFARDGSLYFGNAAYHVVRQLRGGFVFSAASSRSTHQFVADAGDGGPATAASINLENVVAAGPAGELYTGGIYRVRRIGTRLPSFSGSEFLIPSADGSMLYRFDSAGRHLDTRHSLTGEVLLTFGYDGAGRLAAVTQRTGGIDNVTTIERDGQGRPAAIVGPYGQETRLGVDANGWLDTIDNPAGERTTFAYTPGGLMTAMTTPREHTYTYEYDAKRRLLVDADPAGGSQTLERLEIGAGDEVLGGHEVVLHTALDRVSAYRVEHLTNGRRRETNTSAAGVVTTNLFAGDGSEVTEQPSGGLLNDADGPDPRFAMLAPLHKSANWKMPSGLTFVGGQSQSAVLSDPRDLLSLSTLTDTVRFNGRSFVRVYDAETKTFSDSTPLGRTSTLAIDAFARPVADSVPGLAGIAYEYDARGRLAKISVGSGPQARITTLTYDARGLLATVTDPLGRVTGYDYDQAGRLVAETDASGRRQQYGYDLDGNLSSVTPPGRSAHTFQYTPIDLESEYAPPDLGLPEERLRTSYDADRQRTELVLADGRTIATGYDDGGRVETVTFSRGVIGVDYNAAGQIATVAAPGSFADTLTYDGVLLRSDTRSGAVGGAVSWTYDSDFRIASQSINGGETVSFGYDADGLLGQAGDLTLTRAANNILLTGATIGGLDEARSYNVFGELSQYTVRFGATTLYALALTYDGAGRITRKVESLEGEATTYDYSYDLAGRLTGVMTDGAASASYTYDQNGNRLTRSAGATIETSSYDAQDRLLATQQTGPASQRAFTYNAHGQLQSVTVNGQITTYAYDEMDNLVGVGLPDGSDIAYRIDGFNRRVGKSIDGTQVQGFLYEDQLRVTAELDGAGQVVKRFVPGGEVRAEYFTRDGHTYRIVTDQLGSLRLVIDVDDGSVAQRMRHDEFGRVAEDSNPGFTPFGFAGGLYEAATGLVRFGTRDYDPSSGRWTSKDPIGFAAGEPNLYLYAGADPVNYVDVDGRESCGCALGGQGVANVVEIKNANGGGGATSVFVRRKGSRQLIPAALGMPLYVGDEVLTGGSTVAALEFAIGGRTGIGRGSRIRVSSERSGEAIRRPGESMNTPGGIWAKCDKLKQPLEIQTNGGVIGIKG